MFAEHENEYIKQQTTGKWLSNDELLTTNKIITSKGTLTNSTQYSKAEPSWHVESPIKDVEKDLPAYELMTMGRNLDKINSKQLNKALNEVGETYLLEGWLGVPFFDYYATGR